MHCLVIGMTESGKTLLSKLMAKQLRSQGKKVAVLDPICDPDWEADYITDDVEELREYLTKNRSHYVFVDESGAVFNEGNDNSHAWIATRSRHYGHSVFFLAQRAIQIPKTMRDQCSRVYLFTTSASDGKILAEEFNKLELMKCNTLPKLHFMVSSRFDDVQHYRIHKYKTVVKIGGPRNSSVNDSK